LTAHRNKAKRVTNMRPISVLIADRAKSGRATCRTLLEPEKGIRVVGEAASGLDAVTAAERLKPSILLLDLALFNGDGTVLLPVIRRKSPRTRVLLLTDDAPEAPTIEALSHGARGYLEKGALRTYLPRAVRAVGAGEAWVPRKMVGQLMARLAQLSVPA
jgi:two-component system, NarL family, response regulator